MRIVLTGSSGRVGRGIFGALAANHEVIGIDRAPFSSTRYVTDLADRQILRQALTGADVVIHTAALHAPHVGIVPDEQFYKVNVMGTQLVVQTAKEQGVPRFIFTSTTALYRIHRGIDVRDAAAAHVAALSNSGPAYQMYVVSGRTPFVPSDCDQLGRSAREVLAVRCPELVAEYARRDWPLPSTIDRVYASQVAEQALGWRTKWGSAEVFRQYDDGDIEVLPRIPQSGEQTDWPWDASPGSPRPEISGCESG